MVLKKELVLYDRNDKGELIPQEVSLFLTSKDAQDYPELVGETVFVTPLTRGELRTMFGVDGRGVSAQPETTKDDDADIIVKHCANPKYTPEELVFAKPVFVRTLVRTIFRESGIVVDDDTGVRRLDEDADEFGKNS